ncbi:tyrosine-type recombinase/integrase [Rhizobium pisi]
MGLRASEVTTLSFDDIDWRNGRIALIGKVRREEWLPLPQEVGDAILAYIERARPRIATTRVFLTDIAPIRPLSLRSQPGCWNNAAPIAAQLPGTSSPCRRTWIMSVSIIHAGIFRRRRR